MKKLVVLLVVIISLWTLLAIIIGMVLNNRDVMYSCFIPITLSWAALSAGIVINETEIKEPDECIRNLFSYRHRWGKWVVLEKNEYYVHKLGQEKQVGGQFILQRRFCLDCGYAETERDLI